VSAELMIKAFEIAKSDERLTPADKLVLMRWAWTTREGCQPAAISIRGFARELGINKSTVERSIRRLKACGYIVVEAVIVVAGPMFQMSAKSGQGKPEQVSAKSGQGVRKKRTECLQKADTNKERENKKEPPAVNFSDLGRYQRACLRNGNGVMVAGVYLRPDDAEFRRLAQLLRNDASRQSA